MVCIKLYLLTSDEDQVLLELNDELRDGTALCHLSLIGKFISAQDMQIRNYQ